MMAAFIELSGRQRQGELAQLMTIMRVASQGDGKAFTKLRTKLLRESA